MLFTSLYVPFWACQTIRESQLATLNNACAPRWSQHQGWQSKTEKSSPLIYANNTSLHRNVTDQSWSASQATMTLPVTHDQIDWEGESYRRRFPLLTYQRKCHASRRERESSGPVSLSHFSAYGLEGQFSTRTAGSPGDVKNILHIDAGLEWMSVLSELVQIPQGNFMIFTHAQSVEIRLLLNPFFIFWC